MHFEHCEIIRSMKFDCVLEKHGLLLSVTAIKMHVGGGSDQKWRRVAKYVAALSNTRYQRTTERIFCIFTQYICGRR